MFPIGGYEQRNVQQVPFSKREAWSSVARKCVLERVLS